MHKGPSNGMHKPIQNPDFVLLWERGVARKRRDCFGLLQD